MLRNRCASSDSVSPGDATEDGARGAVGAEDECEQRGDDGGQEPRQDAEEKDAYQAEEREPEVAQVEAVEALQLLDVHEAGHGDDDDRCEYGVREVLEQRREDEERREDERGA